MLTDWELERARLTNSLAAALQRARLAEETLETAKKKHAMVVEELTTQIASLKSLAIANEQLQKLLEQKNETLSALSNMFDEKLEGTHYER